MAWLNKNQAENTPQIVEKKKDDDKKTEEIKPLIPIMQ